MAHRHDGVARTAAALIWFLAGFSFLLAGRYLFVGLETAPDFVRPALLHDPRVTRLHILLGMVAMLLGPLQFVLARRAMSGAGGRGHVWTGRTYLVAALGCGGAGLLLARHSFGGFAAHLGFATLSVLVLVSTAVGWLRIRAGDVPGHVDWMTRSYALILGFATFRILLFTVFGAGRDPDAYAGGLWLSILTNQLIAEVLNDRRRSRWRAGSTRREPPAVRRAAAGAAPR